MKKAFLFLLTFVFIALGAKAQDIITLTNGTQIQAKVMEINPGDIKYKDFNNQDGPTITVLKASVSSIQYANGAKTVFNESSDAKPASGHFTRGDNNSRDRNRSSGFRKTSERSSRLNGWYFGLNVNLGGSNATSTDSTYSVSSGGGYASLYFLATRMFNQHIGIQFGLGEESYAYNVAAYNPGYYGYSTDQFSLIYFTLPVRVVYFSNSKKRVGFYGIAGFDFSLLGRAYDNEQDNLTAYYKSGLISPYVSCGVEFRNRNARAAWMFGPFYKTTIGNFYSGNSDVTGLLNPGNSGMLNSYGLSITYMGKFGRGW